ncbi:MAG: type II toxin-antitoxin system HigB family toxin [Lewinellaceae bacterium]|nr:type II toxin-antitoxin system HigB family toxin [Lewinellaceae bacterium]
MIIMAKSILREFGLRHPDSLTPLNHWYDQVKTADWKNISDIRQMYNAVDYVGNDRYVFNIRGNRCRLVVMIFFDIRTVFVRFIGTHQEYDKIDAAQI